MDEAHGATSSASHTDSGRNGSLPQAGSTGKVTIPKQLGQIVLVLQGGGALGAYQAGVYQALHEAGIEPDWVIGTSIGAINASLIAGNAPRDRLTRLKDFWNRVEHSGPQRAYASLPFIGAMTANWITIMSGVPGFFKPNPLAFLGQHVPLGSESAAYYSTAPLEQTLNELVDFEQVKSGSTRLTVGAANVRTSEMRYFDSKNDTLSAKHVMASGALPPGFPPVRIGEDLFWDGGILSNTPVEAVFDDNPRRNSVVFAVHIWNPEGSEPQTLWQVANRQKELQYSSRAVSHIMRQKQIHRLRHIIAELSARLPEAVRKRDELRELAGYGCLTRMHVVRLLAPQLAGEDHTKDIDFSASGIRARWDAGFEHTSKILRRSPWLENTDPVEGFILHEAHSGAMVSTS
jgi:NTE family protein